MTLLSMPPKASDVTQQWETVDLADVATSQLGKMLDATKNKGNLRPYLRNPNVRWFDIETSDIKEMRFEDRELERFSIKKGDVLICEGGEAGRAGIWDGQDDVIMYQKALHRVRCGPKLINRFLVHRLMYDYFTGRLDNHYTGATIKHLTAQDLARYSFQLPPIEEQQRIVTILDLADSLVRRKTKALKDLEGLRSSIFDGLFSSARKLGREWASERLGDLFNVDWGKTSITKASYVPKGTPAYSATGFDGFVNIAEHKGEGIVLSAIGARCGKCFYVPGGEWTAIKNTITITPKEPRSVDLLYAFAIVNDEDFWPNRGAGQPFIAVGTARDQTIPVPPESLQAEYARSAKTIAALEQRGQAALLSLNDLFKALQECAFNGRL